MSRIELGEEPTSLQDGIPDVQLFVVTMVDDFFIDIAEYLSFGVATNHYTVEQKKKLVVRASYYQLIAGQLYKLGLDDILHRCILDHEKTIVLEEAHRGILGGHYVGKATA